MDEESWDVELSSDVAWDEFGQRLTAYVEAMPAGATVRFALPVAEQPERGCTPWVRVVRRTHHARVVVPSNLELAPAYALELAQEQKLFAWGFARPNTPIPALPRRKPSRWWVRVVEEPVEPTAVAEGVVAVLREVLGVIDPAFLDIEGSGDDGEWEALVVVTPPDDEERPSGFGVADPKDPLELRGMIGDLLAEWNTPVTLDDDGDHVVMHGEIPVYLRARADEPTVEIFACLAPQVRSRRQAALELALLNRDHSKVKFQLFGRAVVQSMALPAMPFVGEHVWAGLEEFLAVVDRVHSDLAFRVGGRL